MRLLHAIAFSKKLRWLTQSKVITLKMQLQVYFYNHMLKNDRRNVALLRHEVPYSLMFVPKQINPQHFCV